MQVTLLYLDTSDRLILDLDEAFHFNRRIRVNRCGCCASHVKTEGVNAR